MRRRRPLWVKVGLSTMPASRPLTSQERRKSGHSGASLGAHGLDMPYFFSTLVGSFKAAKTTEVYLDDPLKQAKAKAAATYAAAADHFDDEPLSFWDRIGRRTIDRL